MSSELLSDERQCLSIVEAQILGANLGDDPPGAEASQRQRRLGARRHDHRQPGWLMLEQSGQQRVHGGVVDLVIVVQHQDEPSVELAHRVDEANDVSLIGADFALEHFVEVIRRTPQSLPGPLRGDARRIAGDRNPGGRSGTRRWRRAKRAESWVTSVVLPKPGGALTKVNGDNVSPNRASSRSRATGARANRGILNLVRTTNWLSTAVTARWRGSSVLRSEFDIARSIGRPTGKSLKSLGSLRSLIRCEQRTCQAKNNGRAPPGQSAEAIHNICIVCR